MTGIRLFLCFVLLSLCCGSGFSASAADPAALQQENRRLERQVRRLEAEVDALRNELNSTDYSQVVSGIGYIVGIFGVAAWLAARKKSA